MKRIFPSSPALLPAVLAASLILAGCGADGAARKESPPPKGAVTVLYAGSLATVMENGLGPAFSKATGYSYRGEAHGSLGAARFIRDRLRTPDVFISADPAVNESVLMGEGNGSLVTWYVTLASSQLVLAYSPKSRFAPSFEALAAGTSTAPWYEVLKTPGLRFGRGDPGIDPKGYRTLFLFDLAGKHYRRPDIPGFLGEPLNPAQVVPEVGLLAGVEAGQFDAGVFYKHEVVAHKLPFVTLPPEINLGDPRFASFYAQASYVPPGGEKVSGAPILFTLTIPKTVKNEAGAEELVRFLLSSPDLLEGFGFGIVEHQVGGDREQIPAALRGLTSGTYRP